MELTIESMKAAIRATGDKKFSHRNIDTFNAKDVASAFTRLSDEQKAIGVVCPTCKSIEGIRCDELFAGDHINVAPHASRIERVKELEQNNDASFDMSKVSKIESLEALGLPAEPAASAEGVKCRHGSIIVSQYECEFCKALFEDDGYTPIKPQATEGEAKVGLLAGEIELPELDESTWEGKSWMRKTEDALRQRERSLRIALAALESSRQAGAELIEEAIYIAQQYRMAMGSTYISTELPSAIEEMRRVDKHLAALATLPKKGA